MLTVVPIIGLLTRHPAPTLLVALIGLSGLLFRMLLHLVTLPTEWDASFGKALPVLKAGNYISPEQETIVRRVLELLHSPILRPLWQTRSTCFAGPHCSFAASPGVCSSLFRYLSSFIFLNVVYLMVRKLAVGEKGSE